MVSVSPKTSRYSRCIIQERTKKVKSKNEKEPSDLPNLFREFEGVHPKGSIWSVLRKGGRSLPTIPRLLELVSRLIDIILCINNLLTLLLLTIVKPYLSTNKQLHYVHFLFDSGFVLSFISSHTPTLVSLPTLNHLSILQPNRLTVDKQSFTDVDNEFVNNQPKSQKKI